MKDRAWGEDQTFSWISRSRARSWNFALGNIRSSNGITRLRFCVSRRDPPARRHSGHKLSSGDFVDQRKSYSATYLANSLRRLNDYGGFQPRTTTNREANEFLQRYKGKFKIYLVFVCVILIRVWYVVLRGKQFSEQSYTLSMVTPNFFLRTTSFTKLFRIVGTFLDGRIYIYFYFISKWYSKKNLIQL